MWSSECCVQRENRRTVGKHFIVNIFGGREDVVSKSDVAMREILVVAWSVLWVASLPHR